MKVSLCLFLLSVRTVASYDFTFQGYPAGTVLTDLGDGNHVSALKRVNGAWYPGQAMIFDSSNPTGNDWDLGTPNEEFGGPGRGAAGKTSNNIALGNLLIVSEDEDSTNPDDNVGGILMFTFDEPKILDNCVMVDNEEHANFSVLYQDGRTRNIFLGNGGDNSVETLSFTDQYGFDKPIVALNITMNGSGAVAFVGVKPAPPTSDVVPPPANTCENEFRFDYDDGFTYADDTFRGTDKPDNAVGFFDTANKRLTVKLGATNSQGGQVLHMSGGFQKTFTLMETSVVSIMLNYQLSLSSAYENDEYSETLLSIDGNLIGRNGSDYIMKVAGQGGGNGGMETVTLDNITLSAGTHVLAVGGYNNKKTWHDEVTHIYIGFVEIKAVYGCDAPPAVAPASAPTDAPVVAPTGAPVVAPTGAPVVAPTGAPVVAPTGAPVVAPTGAPVVAPTGAPVVAPTGAPVVAPTDAPVTGAPVATKSGTKPGSCLEEVNPGAICVSTEVFLTEFVASPAQTCSKGEMVTVSLSGSTKVASGRNDLAWWVATDGGDALTGTCTVETLAADGTDYKFTNHAQVSYDLDSCGDIVSETETSFETEIMVSQEVPCIDDDEDGHLDVAICFSWNMDTSGNCDATAPMVGDSKDCNCKKYNLKEIMVDHPVVDVKPC